MAITKDDPLARRLIDDLGYRNFPYLGSDGLWTIGIGHLVDRRSGGRIPDYVRQLPMTDAEVMRLLEEDIIKFRQALQSQEPWVLKLDEPRFRVVMSLVFQLGIGKLFQHDGVMSSIKARNWPGAANAIRKSKEYLQTTKRWERHARIIETGKEDAA